MVGCLHHLYQQQWQAQVFSRGFLHFFFWTWCCKGFFSIVVFLHRVFSIVFSGFGGRFLWCWCLYAYINVTFSIFFVSRSVSFARWNRWATSVRNSQYFLYLPFKSIVIHYLCCMVYETKHLFFNFVAALCMEKIMILTEKGNRERS